MGLRNGRSMCVVVGTPADLRATEEKLIGGPGLSLPSTLRGGAEPLTAFLTEVWRRFR